MALYQVDFWKRVPYAPNPDGYYYWSSVYYIDPADDSPDYWWYSTIYEVEEVSTTQSVQRWGFVTKSEPGMGNIINVSPSGGDENGLIPDPDGYSLLQIARWELRGADGSRSYRLSRQPLRPVDIAGTLLSATGLATQGGALNSFLAKGVFRTRSGALIVSGHVAPEVRGWQLRNGTKRRNRVYLE